MREIDNREPLYVDGSSDRLHGKYLAWTAVDAAGEIFCTFFGPCSAIAAATFVTAWNEGNEAKISAIQDLLRSPQLVD